MKNNNEFKKPSGYKNISSSQTNKEIEKKSNTSYYCIIC